MNKLTKRGQSEGHTVKKATRSFTGLAMLAVGPVHNQKKNRGWVPFDGSLHWIWSYVPTIFRFL